MRGPLSLCLAFLTVVAAPAFGQGQALFPEEPGPRCDLLAADPVDTGKPENLAGVRERRMLAEESFAACTEAVEAHPDEPRYRHNRARALLALGFATKAHTALQALAEEGYVASMLRLAELLEAGRGGETAPEEAYRWYRRAAETGDPNGQTMVGTKLYHGLGVEPDPAAAVRWYKKAAAQGFADAKLFLGLAYQEGRGVEQNEALASRLVIEAAEEGSLNAAVAAGSILLFTAYEKRDPKRAFQLMDRAARQGHLLNQLFLGQWLLDGEFGPELRPLAEDYFCLAGQDGAEYYHESTGEELVCDAS